MDSLNLSSNPAAGERRLLGAEGGSGGWGGVRGREVVEGREEPSGGPGGRGAGEGRGGIVFSPNGSEAFLVTGGPAAHRGAAGYTERVVGARPKTVGQSSEQGARAEEEAAVAPSPRSQGCLTDRALSPSQASVTSLLSGTSTVSNAARRRGLEWDYSEDLGADMEARGQDHAALSLSTLEKLAIGSYTDYLREEPEGRGEGREAAAPSLPTAGQEEMVQGRMSKFADSLMRQREIQERARAQRRRSGSRERV